MQCDYAQRRVSVFSLGRPISVEPLAKHLDRGGNGKRGPGEQGKRKQTLRPAFCFMPVKRGPTPSSDTP